MTTSAFQPLTWRIEHHGQATVVHVAGEVDLATQAQFSQAVRSGLDSPEKLVVLDLTGVDFMSSVGLRAMVQANYDAQEAGKVFRVVLRSGGATRRSIEISGLDQVLASYGTVDEALSD
jgi:anti-sigma B factor antagonist